MIKRIRGYILVVIMLVVLLLPFGCGMEGDPLFEIYTEDVYPGTTSTYDVGSPTLTYLNGYYDNLFVGGVPVGGGGDVVGTPPSVNNTIARYDGITGLLIQGSGVDIDDFDNITTTGDIDGFDINAGNDVNVTNDLDVTDNADIGGDLVVVGSITGSNYIGIDADMVEVEELGVATYDDVQDYENFFGDRTLLSGGGITDNGNGTAAVAAGTAWAKATDSDTAVGKFFDFSANNSVALTDLLTSYIYLDYNAGTPQIVVSTSITTHGFKQDHIHIATIFRNGTTLHYHEEDAIGIGRINIVDMRLLEIHDADRASGLTTSDGGALSLSITSGVIYEGLNRHTASVDGSTWSTWYYDGDLGTPAWVEVTGQSTIDNANYNDVATGLANLTANRYAVHWVYVDIDGANLFIIYGQGNYTINQAEEAGVPASLPDIAVHYGILIAKIIVQEGQTSLEILYPWTITFHSSKATDHGNLAGLADDDHPQYVLEALFDAYTMLYANTDDTPAALTIATSRIVGRLVAGGIDALTIQEVLSLLLTTKGDLITYTTLPVRLGIGGDTTVLTADSGEASGMKWAAPAGGGATYTGLDGSVTTTAAGEGGGDGAWVDWDLSGTLPVGTIAVDIIIFKLIATDSVGVRTNGSALAREFETLNSQQLVLTVDVAADRIIEIQSDDVSDADTFSLIGYWD